MSRFASAVLTVLLAASCATADDAPLPVGVDPSVVLARFRFAPGGDAVLLPVAFAGKTHQFMLDTGASVSAVDRSLLRGAAVDRKQLQTASGEDRTFERFRAPAGATLGPLALDGVTDVIGFDFGPVRAVGGHPVDGVLGVDFLSRRVVHLDFDRGEALVLRSAGPAWGNAVRLGVGGNSPPTVTGAVDGLGEVEFAVDTGYFGLNSATLPGEAYDALLRAGKVRTAATGRVLTASGVSESPVGPGGRLSVGPFAVPAAVYDVGGYPLLGLGFWSRFAVTLDLPNQVMYLRPGKNYGRADAWNRSGVSVLAQDGKVVVRYLVAGGPGDKAGVKAGDELRSAGGAAADPGGLFALRRKLAEPGSVACVFRRDGVDRAVTLDLGR